MLPSVFSGALGSSSCCVLTGPHKVRCFCSATEAPNHAADTSKQRASRGGDLIAPLVPREHGPREWRARIIRPYRCRQGDDSARLLAPPHRSEPLVVLERVLAPKLRRDRVGDWPERPPLVVDREFEAPRHDDCPSGTHERGVALPVGWIAPPAARRRPDPFRVREIGGAHALAHLREVSIRRTTAGRGAARGWGGE